MTKKLFSILKDLKLEYSFYFLMSFSVISSLLEILSISSVLPLVGIIIDPEIFLKNEYLANFLQHNYFDKILKENLNNNIAILLIFLIITIFTTKFLFQIFFEWYRANIIYNIDRRISSSLYNYYINLPFKFHVNTNTSKIHRNIQGDAKSVSNIFKSLIIIFTESLIIFGLVSILLYIDWFITFATLLSLAITGSIFLFLSGKFNVSLGKKVHKESEKRIKHLINGFEGIKDFIIYDKISDFFELFDKSNKNYANANKYFSIILSLPKIIIEFLFILVILSVLLYFTLIDQSINQFLPVITLIVVSMIRIAPSCFRIINSNQQIKFNKVSIDNIFKDLKYGIRIKNFPKLKKSKNFINFNSKGKKILKNLNLNIKKGEFIGIYGSSGSGKSTFLNILAGLFKPNTGKIISDNNDIFQNIKSWRKNIGYVPQKVYLLDENIAKNVSLEFKKHLNDKKIFKEAINIAGLKNVSNNLKLRQKDSIGEKGGKISGGQAQRVGIARAIYNKPEILLFDEATSSLDKHIEKKIINSIYKLRGKKTVIIVSHKLELLKNCDKIFSFENGKMIKKRI
jgi:ABC-type bacteriocin/lantibiotic exporter with double-glycine peptidase domain